MKKTKFTVRVDAKALEAAKVYAGQHHTTVTSLVEAYFLSLSKVGEISLETPILWELAGSLGSEATLEAYRAYLEGKYLDGEMK